MPSGLLLAAAFTIGFTTGTVAGLYAGYVRGLRYGHGYY